MSVVSVVDWPSFALGTLFTLSVIGIVMLAVRRFSIERSTPISVSSAPQPPLSDPPTLRIEPDTSDEVASNRDVRAPAKVTLASPGLGKLELHGSTILFLVLAVIAAIAILAYAWLRRDHAPTSSHSPGKQTTPPIVVIVNILHVKMDRGFDEPWFAVERHPNAEVVEGSRGAYYRIDLKDAQAKRLIFFQGGKYLQDEFGDEFRTALGSFRSEVTAVLDQGSVPFRIFVRGSADIVADAEPVIGELVGGASKNVAYYPASDSDPNRFLRVLRHKTIMRQFANQDLPYLRASYIQDRLADGDFESIILEGGVTDRENEKDRNVTILLFVDWPLATDIAPRPAD